jgi:hypothetical protein
MFLKRCARRKAGKKHVYWQLVESYRVRGGCRHRVVAYLGELSKGEHVGCARLGRLLDGKAAAKAQQLSLFDGPGDGEGVPDSIRVDLKKLRVERTRDFGEVYLGLVLGRMLGLDELFECELDRGKLVLRSASQSSKRMCRGA